MRHGKTLYSFPALCPKGGPYNDGLDTSKAESFMLTAVLYLARIATKLTNTTQRSSSDYKLLRTFEMLSSYETDTNIL